MTYYKRTSYLSPILLLYSLCGLAQEQLTPTERKQKTIVTEPQTLYKGFLRAGLAFNYSTVDKTFDGDGKRAAWPSNLWATAWFFQSYVTYGITDRLQAEIVLPYRFQTSYQSTSFEAPGLGIGRGSHWKNVGKGIGDINITMAYQVLPETERRPSFSVYVTGILPTGEKNPLHVKRDELTEIFGVKEFDPPMGYGESSVLTEFRVRKIRYPFSYLFTGSYQVSFGGQKILDANDTMEKAFRSGSNIALYGVFNFHLNDWIAFRNSAQYFFSVRDEFDGVKEDHDSWVIEYIPGVVFQIKQFRIAQAVTVPIIGKWSSADPSFTVALGYTF